VTGPWRYERVEDAGHWLQLDAPDKVNDLLLDFLDHTAERPTGRAQHSRPERERRAVIDSDRGLAASLNADDVAHSRS
jgi:hypothetical protein